jgi:hypothetical protein
MIPRTANPLSSCVVVIGKNSVERARLTEARTRATNNMMNMVVACAVLSVNVIIKYMCPYLVSRLRGVEPIC